MIILREKMLLKILELRVLHIIKDLKRSENNNNNKNINK